MNGMIQPGRVYLAEVSDARIPVRALRPLLDRPGWWAVICCRSDTRIHLPAAALLEELTTAQPPHDEAPEPALADYCEAHAV